MTSEIPTQMNAEQLKPVIEAILMVAEQPIPIERLAKLVAGENGEKTNREVLRETLAELQSDYSGRGIELAELASGYRFRTRREYAEQVGRLWDERKPRYSRAFMETLAIIAYRQPITRGEIEHIRGVAVSTNIMRQLLERDWIRVVGHRDVPGRPSVYATTNGLLDYFGLKSLDELPSLAELKDIDDINTDLFADPPANQPTVGAEASDTDAESENDETAAEVVSEEDLDDIDLEATADLEPLEALAETGELDAVDVSVNDLEESELEQAESDPASDEADPSAAAG